MDEFFEFDKRRHLVLHNLIKVQHPGNIDIEVHIFVVLSAAISASLSLFAIDCNALVEKIVKNIETMPPPDIKGKGKTVMTYIEPTMITVNSAPDEEPDNGVTYFVDEEGRYYYQPAGDNQSIVSLPTAVTNENEGIAEEQRLVDGEAYQTVALVPSDTGTGEVSYVLVVQEDNKSDVKIGIKMDEDKLQEDEEEKGNEDVYTFEDDEEGGEEQSAEEDEPTGKAKPATNKRKYLRPHFTCTICTYTSHRRFLLLRHMKSHSEDRPHKCGVCERGFKTIASLQNHVNMHNGVKPHICKYCNSSFTTSGELVRHVRYKHTHEKPHKCTECDYASVELSKLRRHMRCHTGERPYQCPNCTYASPDTFKLKRHLRTHTGEKPYKCDHCNMCFTQSNSLKAHKLIHNVAEKPVYACELCPAKCGRKTDLRVHVQKLHTSDKPLKCKRCGKTFPDRYSCKVHIKTHEGEKCFKCELCPYASTTLRHLKSHMLKHTDQKPFACEECDQSFRQKQLLRRHQNLYHNPNYVPKPPKEKTHTCHECQRTFAHKGNLIRHLAVHDPDSGHQERALELKLGRQRKIKYVDASIQARDEEEEEEEEPPEEREQLMRELRRGELVTVADGDHHQYVVLEVIQLEDGTEQVAVVAPDYVEDQEDDEEEADVEKKYITEEQIRVKRQADPGERIKLEKDVESCFGFDEEEETEHNETNFNQKLVLRIV
ncbi:hypothetical protein evm_005736 [Chilo suppressalis]|nr:hypothetical protein evm_005736 [Chilo suppressalis]